MPGITLYSGKKKKRTKCYIKRYLLLALGFKLPLQINPQLGQKGGNGFLRASWPCSPLSLTSVLSVWHLAPHSDLVRMLRGRIRSLNQRSPRWRRRQEGVVNLYYFNTMGLFRDSSQAINGSFVFLPSPRSLSELDVCISFCCVLTSRKAQLRSFGSLLLILSSSPPSSIPLPSIWLKQNKQNKYFPPPFKLIKALSFAPLASRTVRGHAEHLFMSYFPGAGTFACYTVVV